MEIRDFDQLQNQNNSENQIQNNQSLRESDSVKELRHYPKPSNEKVQPSVAPEQ